MVNVGDIVNYCGFEAIKGMAALEDIEVDGEKGKVEDTTSALIFSIT